MNARHQRILLTGATGYVGGRLLGRLRQAGHTVRCLVRRPEYLLSRVDDEVEIVEGDVLDRGSLERWIREPLGSVLRQPSRGVVRAVGDEPSRTMRSALPTL